MCLSRLQQKLLYLVIVLVGLGIGFVHVVELQHNMYKAESKCVQDLIDSGIERKDIVTNYGTCSVKTIKAP